MWEFYERIRDGIYSSEFLDFVGVVIVLVGLTCMLLITFVFIYIVTDLLIIAL